MRVSLGIALITALIGFAGGPVSALPLYHVTTFDLPQTEPWNQAYGLNDHGTVVGETTPQATAFAWDGTHAVQRLPVPPGYLSSSAHAINNSGQVVGWAEDSAGRRRAVLWEEDGVTDLGDLGNGSVYAEGINDSGEVVGSSGAYGFTWREGVGMTSLGLYSWANDINNEGMIVGNTGPSTSHAAVWMPGQAVRDIGGLPDSHESAASAVNNFGQVVGFSTFPSGPDPWLRGFVWAESGGFTEIPALAGALRVDPADINDSGVVVGMLEYPTRPYAFIYTPDSGTIDLNNLLDSESQDWSLYRAYGINNSGQIVGYGVNPNIGGDIHAFLLTPVPESSGFLILGSGILALAGIVRKKHG